MKIAVAGATGRVGHHLVDVLKEMGQNVVEISRSTGVDVITREGLDQAVQEVDCIVDATSGPSEQKAATEFFTTTARNLQDAGKKAGVKRIVLVSIIGIDRFTGGYMAAKVVHEKTMQSGTIPLRILRAAQFHELVPQMIEWGKQGDVSYVLKMKTQLVAARSVAEELAKLAVQSKQSNSIVEVAGPRPEDMVEAAKKFVARRGDNIRIEAASNANDPDRDQYESAAVLPGPNAILTGPTFDEWLHSTLFEEKFVHQ